MDISPNWHDVAISPPIPLVEGVHHAVSLDAPSWWLSEQQERDNELGPADDVFMIGRFIDYDGVETNKPALRFGHISMIDPQIRATDGIYWPINHHRCP
jgi:hypothetical protein